MRSNIKPENRRLLEAIEYIDEDIVLGVLGGLKDPVENAVHGEYKKPSPFKHWRQFTALAACLLLLSAAFPVLNYAVQRFGAGAWEGNAGAGESSDIELNEYGSPYERAIDAYPADMPAEEIYADVLKGGWIVGNITTFGAESGIELWNDFCNTAAVGKEARALIAEYWESNPYYDMFDPPIPYNKEQKGIVLSEIVFDGKNYSVHIKSFMPEDFWRYAESGEETLSYTYQYLICDDKYYEEGVCFILSDDPEMTIEKWKSSFSTVSSDVEDFFHLDDTLEIMKLKWQDYYN